MFELSDLLAREEEGIVITFASLAFNRAQGRALPEDSNDIFKDFIKDNVWRELSNITKQEKFERIHEEWIQEFRKYLYSVVGTYKLWPRRSR